MLFVAGLAAGAARGQTPGAAARFERLSLEQGLSQSSVPAALQTRDGFLWFGTQDGLNRYDGYTFCVYRHDPRDARSLSTSYVQALAETRDGTLWVGTWGGGLDRFDRRAETFAALRHRDGDPGSLPDDIVTALLETRDGVLWVGTASGLCRLDAARRRCAAVYADAPGALSHPFVWSLAQGADGALWAGTLGGGACRMEPARPSAPNARSRFHCFRHRDGDPASLPDDGNAVVHADRAGRVWVGTAGGLARLNADGRTFAVFGPGPRGGALGGAQVNALLEDRAGRLWAGTGDGGLSRLDAPGAAPGAARFVTYRNNAAVPTSLSKDVVRALPDPLPLLQSAVQMRKTLLPLLFAGALAAGCDSSSGEGANPVSVRFATMPGAAALGKTAADEIVIAGTNGKLTITDVRFIVSKFKLEDESLACEHGDEGDDDRGGRRGDDDRRDGHDDDDDGCGEFESDPFFVDLPLASGTVSVATTAIPAGSYSKLEFRIKDVNLDASDGDDDDERGDDSADDDAALRAVAAEVRAAFPQWPCDASLVVTGTFLPAGSTTARPFTSFFEAEVRVERRLVPPLTVDGPTTLTLDVDPRAWFLASGAALDLSAFDYARTGRVVEFKTRVRDGFARVRHGD